MAETRELGIEDCERLLRGQVVGRVAVSTPSGPHIIPVNYAVVGNAIIIRTAPYSLLGTYGRNAQLAFEVDSFDETDHSGWSVVARGHAEAVTDPDEIQKIREQSPAPPWADGTRNLYVKLRWTELAGRVLGTGLPRDEGKPGHQSFSTPRGANAIS